MTVQTTANFAKHLEVISWFLKGCFDPVFCFNCRHYFWENINTYPSHNADQNIIWLTYYVHILKIVYNVILKLWNGKLFKIFHYISQKKIKHFISYQKGKKKSPLKSRMLQALTILSAEKSRHFLVSKQTTKQTQNDEK